MILCAINLDASFGSGIFFCFPFFPGAAAGGAGAGRLSWPGAGCPFVAGGSDAGGFAAPFARGVAGRGAAVVEVAVWLVLDMARSSRSGRGVREQRSRATEKSAGSIPDFGFAAKFRRGEARRARKTVSRRRTRRPGRYGDTLIVKRMQVGGLWRSRLINQTVTQNWHTLRWMHNC